MNNEYDVLVVGAGPAGSTAALHASALGARVAVVDRRRTGGTCTNTGCVPTRVLAITARLLRDIRGAGQYGIEVGEPRVLWPRTLARVREVIASVQLNKRVQDRLREAGGSLFLEGEARFVSPHAVRLADTGRELRADKVILCVGGHSRRPPIPGVEHAIVPEGIVDLDELPRSVAIVGSGYTGVQLTTIMNAFGARVTLLEVQPTILPGADRDVGRALRDGFERQGVRVVTGIGGVDAIEPTEGGGRRLTYNEGGRQHRLECDAVVLCVGWPAATEGLGLEALGVELERGYIRVNQYLQTSLEHVYVAGDANGSAMLVQGAHFEARAAAENAVGGAARAFDHALLPNGGFTDPDHAGVGVTEEEARDRGLDCAVAVARYADLDRAIIDNRTAGFLKLLADRRSGLILGAHAAGENAVEVVQAVALAMGAGATAATLAGVELAYPTYAAIVGEAATRLRPMVARAGADEGGPAY